MTSVGIRELRQRASELIHQVEQGETIQITDRGRPVAVLAPLPDEGAAHRMRASGDLTRSEVDFDELPEPLVLEAGQTATEHLARLRRDER